MTYGFIKKLALAAPLVACLPFCVVAAEGTSANQEESPKIFEEFSLTSASADMADPNSCVPAPMTANPAPAASCCGDGQCANGQCCDPGCCQPCLFFAGVDATFFHAQTRGSLVAASVNNTDLGTGFGQGNTNGFDQFTYSPRVYAGVQDGCWGVLGRFWYMSDSTNGLQPFVPVGPATGDYTMNRLKAYTADLELTRIICCDDTKINLYFGGRYGSFESGQGLDISKLVTPTEIGYSNSFSKFSFNGIGLTGGFLGRTPIGCNTCISLIYGARASVLFGNAQRNVQTSATLIDSGADATSINSAAAQRNDTAYILEALLGVQWDHQLVCLPMSAYLRIAAEYQYWNLGGTGAVSTTSTALVGVGGATATASIGSVSMNLVGLTVGTGFNW